MDIAVGTAAIADKAQDALSNLEILKGQLSGILGMAQHLTETDPASTPDLFLSGLTVFVLACFVGYYVVRNVTQALHSPLMAVTNAISSVIILGAVGALGAEHIRGGAFILAFLAAVLASVNIFGGFSITQRMLGLFKSKRKRSSL